jgi:hypothetical protein
LNAPPSADRSNDFRIEYVAALYVSGRARQAAAEFERLPYTRELRSLRNCSEANRLPVPENRATDPCAATASQVGAKWQLLESLLNRRNEDPYLLIEGGGSVSSESALWIETKRRLFTGENYAGLHRMLAERWVRYTLAAPRPEIAAVEVRFMSSELLKSGDTYEKKMRAVAARWNVNEAFDRPAAGRIAATPPALPAGFREFLLPEQFRTGAAEQRQRSRWPADMAPLPMGFSFVRFERGTLFTVAISLSQNLDPVGEVSQGGYWVHLSRDNGVIARIFSLRCSWNIEHATVVRRPHHAGSRSEGIGSLEHYVSTCGNSQPAPGQRSIH